MSRPRFVDDAPGTGVFEGDLKYGRCNGSVPSKHGDHSANRKDGIATNAPVVPLTLVQPRESTLWTRDPRIKEVKKNVVRSQHAVNKVIELYHENAPHMNANIHITFGKQRLA